MHALVVTYSLHNGTSRAEHAELCEELAPAFAAVGGLVSKTWLANEDTGCYGAFYVFESQSAFGRFVASELFATLQEHHSLRAVTANDFNIELGPTAITRGVVTGGAHTQTPLAAGRPR